MLTRAILFWSTFLITSAQILSASEPDYSKVNDFLDGRRTLLAINDIIIGGLVLPTSDGTKIDDKSIYTLPGYDPKNAGPEISTRVFNSSYDTLVYTNGDTIFMQDLVSKKVASFRWAGQDLRSALIAAGDFRGDGFNEVVIATNGGSRIVAAQDPNDFSKGIFAGAVSRPSEAFGDAKPAALAVADIRGRGRRYVVTIYNSETIPRGRRQGVLVYHEVDPKLLQITSAGGFKNLTEPSTNTDFALHASLAAGRFGTTLRDQLAVAYYTTRTNGSHVGELSIKSFDLEQYITHTVVPSLPAVNSEVVLKTGRFDPNSPYEQVAMKWNSGRAVFLGIVSFDKILNIRLPNFTIAPPACSTPGLAVGNFSRTEPIPQDPSKTQLSLKLQLAIETYNCFGRDMGLNIFNVNPPTSSSGDFVVEQTQAFTKTTNDPIWLMYLNTPIVAGDVQGRSYILGDPSKVVIEDTDQPSVIAAMPPMHVDFIPPVGSNEPEELNLSAIPDGFRTLYETTSSEKFESSTVNTTSLSFGARQSVASSVEVGDVEAGLGAKVSAAVRAAQDFKGIAEREHGSYTTNDFSVHLKTGFSDHVWFTATRFNIFVYPVIGRTVCPAAKPNCKDYEKVPLTIQYSAPDLSSYEHVDGKLLPWYQPAWEPGNVFSYPATYEQLQQAVPAIEKLSADHTWRTDGSTLTEETKWTTESRDGSSASFDQNYSFEYDLSVVGACCGRLVTGTVSAELNLSGSFGFTNLNKAVATVGKSTGIGVEKPGTFLTPTNYNYPVTPYIFGQPNPPNLVDKVPLEGDVETAGILRTAFVADPARNNSGSWWKTAYSSAPDVALNHPSRWEIDSLGLENPIPPNCRQVGSRESTMDCAVFGPSFPNKPWDSLFHIMRGFFISSALNPGKGPQLTTAKAGDKLTLQARVYNYSFTPMNPDNEVHVRFYVQPVDNLKQLIGNSRLINDQDVVLSPIPPLSDEAGAPVNWVLANTTFDTTPYANQYLTFWVVVWMQSPGGKLVKEIRGHGLQQIPGTLNSIADVKPEKYSNNVGFYNSEFYVFPASSVEASPSPSAEPATVAMDALQLSDCHAGRGQVIDVSTLISAEGNSASGVTAIFYDGDPHAGGTAFGVERAPYVAENGLYKIEAPYYASTCGTHEIFVVVHEGSPNEVSRKSPLTVDCTASKR
ncbi:MAG: hypothetical protein JOY53_17165 [Acidobacteriaceae bacterium]|nr:hypothetical protein [Acidobacteriaceae bacterium]